MAAEEDQEAPEVSVVKPAVKRTLMQAAEAGDENAVREMLQKDTRQMQDTDKVRAEDMIARCVCEFYSACVAQLIFQRCKQSVPPRARQLRILVLRWGVM